MRQKSQQFLSTFLLTGIIFTFHPRRGPHFFQFAIDFSLPRRYNIPRNMICGRSSMVEHQLPKLNTRVRFPSPAPGVAPQAIRDHHLGGGRDFFCSRFYLMRVSRQRNSAEQVEQRETWLVGSAALPTFCGKGQGRRFFSAACSFHTKSRRAKPRGIFLSRGATRFSPELTERQRGQLLPSPQKVTLRLRCSLVNAVAVSFASAKLGRASRTYARLGS